MSKCTVRTLVPILALWMTTATAQPDGPTTGWINAKEAYGLVGDGKADDTAGLRAAFSSAQAVFLPRGTYRITASVAPTHSTKIYGAGGGWNPKGQTTILYDGPEGGMVIKAANVSFFQMRHVNVNGNGKAAIGIYWLYTVNEACLEDVAIVGTTQHALYITKTWYAHFNRLAVRNNAGNGITLDRSRDPKLAKGAVNYVTFFQCKSSNNGGDDRYDGETVFDTGYGFGSFGNNNSISVIACVFEANGGPAVYIADHPVSFLFQGCYMEQNSRAVTRRVQERYGNEWRSMTDREPMGRAADIIEDTQSVLSLAFDTCYMHGSGGIWLRGTGRGTPIEFRTVALPLAVWSEHGNWVFTDMVRTPVAGRAGVLHRPAGQRYQLHDPSGTPSGHPGYVLDQGVRRIWPYEAKTGLDLYVDTSAGADGNDGRTWETAWGSLEKATSLFSDTTLDAPVRIHVRGDGPADIDIRNVSGSGELTVAFESDVSLHTVRATNITCALILDGGGKVTSSDIAVVRCPDVRITRTTIDVAAPDPGLRCEGASGVVLRECRFDRAGPATDKPIPALVARSNSRVHLADCTVHAELSVLADEGAIVSK